MSKLIILSKNCTQDLPLIQGLVEKNKDNILVLLSDAVFLLNNDKTIDFFNTIVSSETKILALEEDIAKRNPKNKYFVTATSYVELINYLFNKERSIVNL